MASFPVQVLRGIYLGLLTGVVPALVAYAMAVLFRHVTGLTVPSFAVVVLGVAIAGINGGFLAFNDPSIVGSENNVALVTAVLVVMLVSFYAHNAGDQLGARLPHRLTWQRLRERSLSTDVVDLVGGRGQVRVTVVGDVDDMEGYPPLPEELRASIRDVEWTFPADYPLSELESRFAERLHTEFDLADVAVSIDERARATVSAAPPTSGVSRRVPAGQRAASVSTLVPTGLARGDEIAVHLGEETVEGTIVSARSEGTAATTAASPPEQPTTEQSEPAVRAPTTSGGSGRVTVATDRASASTLLAADEGDVVVRSRGKRREFELVSLLHRAKQHIRRYAVREDGPLDGATLEEAAVREQYGVVVLALRTDGSWTVAPHGEAEVTAGDEVFAAGSREALDAFGEGVA